MFWYRLYRFDYHKTFHEIVQILRKFLCKIVLIEFFKINVFTKLYKHYETLFFRNVWFKQSILAKESPNNMFWDRLYRFVYEKTFHKIVQMLRKFVCKIVRIECFTIKYFTKLYKHYEALLFITGDLRNLFSPRRVQITSFEIVCIDSFTTKRFTKLYK